MTTTLSPAQRRIAAANSITEPLAIRATIAYVSSTEEDNKVRIARVAAANRVKRARIVREHHAALRRLQAAEYAERVIATLRAEGATQVGFKICDEMGKYRTVLPIEHAASLIASTYRADAEVWGLDAAGNYTGSEVW